MKFSEMPYKRIDMEEVEKEYKSIIERTKNAKKREEQLRSTGSTINYRRCADKHGTCK